MTHIGILGWWQLAQMLLQAAADFDVETTVLEKEVSNICKDLATYSLDWSLEDAEVLRQLVKSVDITTYEIEHMDVQTLLELASQGHRFAPSPQILEIIQDKGKQKDFFKKHNLPTAPYRIVQTSQDISAIVNDFLGDKIVLKSCTWGYDGKGVMVIEKDMVNSADLFVWPILVEQYISWATEIAVMVARDWSWEVTCWDSVEMVFNEYNTLAYQLCPARISEEIAEQAQMLARQAIEAFAGVGVFAVEFFLTSDDELLINEIAPRPHNSGHHTIDACETSQFTQLVRILLWLPLGSVDIKGSSMMINLLGPTDHVGAYQFIDEAILASMPDVFVHLYGKQLSKPNRKLGHVTILWDSIESLLERYTEIQHLLHFVPVHD